MRFLEKNFIKCGIIGWCFEIIWTGLINFLHNDRKMTSNTSILMFPIYGSACLIKPVCKSIKKMPLIVRGSIYTIMIFSMEYSSGYFLRKFNMCPWDYSKSRYNIKGLIRLDYAPAWFSVGLIYEKILMIHSRDS